MRPLPDFPDYRTAKPPAAKRWLGAGALLVLAVGAASALLRGTDAGSGIVFAAMLFTLIFMGLFWLLSLLYYRFSIHHSSTWKAEVAQVQSHWWYQHRRQFSLEDVVLIGPAGAEMMDWLRLLKREQKAPAERQEANGKALRVARSFSSDATERANQLARMLVLQWKRQREGKTLSSPQRCYWQGSESAWQAFVAQMNDSFPGIMLPVAPQRWMGERTLSDIAAFLSSDKNSAQILVAGCQSVPASAESLLPAGEATVLWLAGCKGAVFLSRGEIFSPSATESLKDVCERAQEQSELSVAPDACILFSHLQQSELAGSGWNITHHLQDKFWGNMGQLEALVVIALAAIFAQTQSQPCGWMAADPSHPLALGIIHPHEDQ
ncbi:hypothetical protein [Klebsiella michiganensis]|uniref:Type VI secretion protein n=1 Tax=Klebsiella michiganensis TaxID=1134687 RepID=A0AB35WD58_9ENTR|nr:hypothetical protein [Klebsiella michiganensis]MDU1153475.1 hypothetical protein [Klebsiella michiganensis]MDU1209574.1 hypothetical protein [Klebsiella michiganensis]MEC6052031.1 hypothetical protein [Klebsiella michiganensis]UHD07077.1 hypothetical protein LUW94_09560 [Klebsiella michiganensis]